MSLHAEIIGYIGSFTLSFMALPQIYTIYKTKSSNDLSYGTLAMLMIGYILFAIYGILISSLPIMTSLSLSIVNCIILIGLKYKYDQPNKLETLPK